MIVNLTILKCCTTTKNTAQNGGSAIYNTGENFTLHGRFDHNLPWIHSINISEGYDIPYGDIENFTIWWHEGDNVIPGVYSTVGLVYIGCAVKDKVYVNKYNFNGERNKVRQSSVAAALSMIRKCVIAEYSK